MKEITLEELQLVEELLKKVTPGPWNTGKYYDFARVNDGSGPDDWEDKPAAIPEGGCHWCHPQYPEAKLVGEGVGPEGQNYHVHEHNDWEATGLENVPEEYVEQILKENGCTREEYDALVREEQEKIDNDPRYRDAPWRYITSADTFQIVIGMYHYEQGGIATNREDADFIAQCRELVPRLIEALKRLMPAPLELPKTGRKQIERNLLADHIEYITCAQGKYHQDQILLVPFKFTPPKVIVKLVESFDKVEDHPYFDELTKAQKERIGDKPFDVVWFYKLR
jgi:hypothetical protein